MTSSEALQRDFDLIVIGTGPAGIHAAVQAAKIFMAKEKGLSDVLIKKYFGIVKDSD